MWPLKMAMNLSRLEVLMLEDTKFQLQKREAFSSCHRFSTIATIPIPWSHFKVPQNLGAHPISTFPKTMCWNPATLTNNIKKQTRDHWTHGRILYCWSHCLSIFMIWSDNQHCIQGGHCLPCYNWRHPTVHVPKLHQNVLLGFEKERERVYYKHLYYVFKFLCKVDYNNDKFIYTQTYAYNKLIRLLELAGVVESV